MLKIKNKQVNTIIVAILTMAYANFVLTLFVIEFWETWRSPFKTFFQYKENVNNHF